MSVFLFIIVFLVLIAIVAAFFVASLRKGVSGIKVMLFGLNVTLLGGIIAVDPNSNLGGFEYLIVFVGLLISLAGLGKRD
jgi:hypothetical protein